MLTLIFHQESGGPPVVGEVVISEGSGNVRRSRKIPKQTLAKRLFYNRKRIRKPMRTKEVLSTQALDLFANVDPMELNLALSQLDKLLKK